MLSRVLILLVVVSLAAVVTADSDNLDVNVSPVTNPVLILNDFVQITYKYTATQSTFATTTDATTPLILSIAIGNYDTVVGQPSFPTITFTGGITSANIIPAGVNLIDPVTNPTGANPIVTNNLVQYFLTPVTAPGTVTIVADVQLTQVATSGPFKNYFEVDGTISQGSNTGSIALPERYTDCLNGASIAPQFSASACVGGDSGTSGDPQFVGLQGQNYQFHGMADEVFSLVSTPALQMNSLFKFIANGNCQYNNTVCWSHPGTYLGQIGVQFGATQISFQSGAHSVGQTVVVNGKVIESSTHAHIYHNGNLTLTMVYNNGEVTLSTSTLYFQIVNSDYFFNMDFGVRDEAIIRAGAKSLVIKGEICELEARKVVSVTGTGKIQAQLAAAYPAVPMHGLLGQTWRNAMFCGRYFEGTVDDYVTGGLFSNQHTFNYYKSQ
jgi:hypothetical protein